MAGAMSKGASSACVRNARYMRTVAIYSRHDLRNKTVTYHAEIRSCPLWKHLAWEVYHWYDMRIPCKIPGWQRFEGWLKRRGAEMRCFAGEDEPQPRWRDRLLAWTVQQDIRCYEVTQWAYKREVFVPLTDEQYERIKETGDNV